MSLDRTPQMMCEFGLRSQHGMERLAAALVLAAVVPLQLSTSRQEQLRSAVAEAVMNGIEHGNRCRAELPVFVQVLSGPEMLVVRVTDRGGGSPIVEGDEPDLAEKLAGRQSPRGWGLFLMRSMVDDLHITATEEGHTVELVLYLNQALTGKDGYHGST